MTTKGFYTQRGRCLTPFFTEDTDAKAMLFDRGGTRRKGDFFSTDAFSCRCREEQTQIPYGNDNKKAAYSVVPAPCTSSVSNLSFQAIRSPLETGPAPIARTVISTARKKAGARPVVHSCVIGWIAPCASG